MIDVAVGITSAEQPPSRRSRPDYRANVLCTGDGFREPGFSKERRLEPQIAVGLLTDQGARASGDRPLRRR